MSGSRSPLVVDTAYTPERDAFSYPGVDVGCSYLLTRSAALPIEEQPGVPLGSSLVVGPGGRRTTLDHVLVAGGHAPTRERYGVIAFGANRNPHHLAHRMLGVPKLALPVFRARLVGAAVVFPAYVGTYGVVTSTLVAEPDTESHVHFLLCDRAQLNALHQAEGIGVRHDFGSLDGCRVVLPTGETVTAPHAYSCRPGVALIDGSVRRLARVPVERSPLPAATLDEVTAWLIRLAREAGLAVEDWRGIQALCLAGRRDELIELMRAHSVEHRLEFTPLNHDADPYPAPKRPYGASGALA